MNPTTAAQHASHHFRGAGRRACPAGYAVFETRVMNRSTSSLLPGRAFGLIAGMAATAAAIPANCGASAQVVYHCDVRSNLPADHRSVKLLIGRCPSRPRASNDDFKPVRQRALSHGASTAYTVA